MSFRLFPTDFDNFRALCASEKIGQSEMFAKLLNAYLNKEDVGAFEGNNPQKGNVISQPIKFISRLYNRTSGIANKRACIEFEGFYLYSDSPIRQPEEAFYYSGLIKRNYGIDDANNYLITHSVSLAKITKRQNGGNFFLGESLRLLRRDSHVYTVWNDWCYILKTADEVMEKLSNYADDFQRSQIEYLLIQEKEDENDFGRQEEIFAPDTSDKTNVDT